MNKCRDCTYLKWWLGKPLEPDYYTCEQWDRWYGYAVRTVEQNREPVKSIGAECPDWKAVLL